ncbi:MAG: hypothetical protein GF364_04290 [Candidatus Lokiarchaeota archaeon]|nr:hypothetical protein [Candidatus Lokiarchaeota archaeon]
MSSINEENSLTIKQQTVFFTSSESMQEIRDDSIDVIVTSPPYNRGKNYASDADKKYDDNKPESVYIEFLEKVWTECLRVASNNCVFFLNIGDSANDQGISELVANSAESVGWIRIQDIIWVKSIYGKGHYTPSGRNKRLNNVWEHIFMFVKNKSTYSLNPKAVGIPYADKSNIGRYSKNDLRDPGNVFHICYEKTTGAKIKKGHDAPFPIGLPYTCIKLVEGVKRVLDPFLGTGTTLAAANALGKRGFGYEKFPKKKLIEKTIIAGKDYSVETDILIPHYESSISTLLNIINRKGNINPPTTKKEEIEYYILMDTLLKMNIRTDIVDELRRYIPEEYLSKASWHAKSQKNDKSKQNLDQYILSSEE